MTGVGQGREDLRQIGLVQLSSIPFRPVTPNIGHPFALASRAVLRDKIGNVLAALAQHSLRLE
jgi:hypothetical protein